MNKNLIIAIVLVVLIVISVVQAIQLGSLKTKIGSSGVTAKVAASTTNPTVTSGNNQQVNVPSNLNDLPEMVGGC